MVSSIWSPPLPDLTKVETTGIAAGALLSPLWFFTIGGVNLNPADFVLLFVFISIVLRTKLFHYTQSRKTGVAILVFLTTVGLSVLWSPKKLEGLLSFAQYMFIFVAVVPIVGYALRNRLLRWRVFLAVWAATTTLTLLGILWYISGDVSRFRDITLWYGNQNQFFWVVSVSFISSIAIVLEDSLPISIRLGTALLAAIEAGLIVGGMTLSAVLMVAGGLWLFAAFFARRHSKHALTVLALGTCLGGIASLAVVYRNWEFFYVQGSLHARIPQYTTAISVGLQHFPLGKGIDGYSPSVHNFFLDYFVEIGLTGAVAFLAIIWIWCRNVLLQSLRYPSRISPFEFAFVAMFGTYVLVMSVQPVPVHRFWWVLFGASWAVAQDRLVS